MRASSMLNVLLLLCVMAVEVAATSCDLSIKYAVPNKGERHMNKTSCNNRSNVYSRDGNSVLVIPSIWFTTPPEMTFDCDSSGLKQHELWDRDRAKWSFEGYSNAITIEQADQELNPNCTEYCRVKAENRIFLYFNNHAYHATLYIKCKDQLSDLYTNGRQVDLNTAKCNPQRAWHTAVETKLHSNIFEPMRFECRKAPIPCTFHAADGLQYDNATKTLTCAHTADSFRIVKFNSERYSSLKCEFGFDRVNLWTTDDKTADNEPIEWVTNASPTLTATCDEYCASTGDREIYRSYRFITATCADPDAGFIYNSRRYKKLECSKYRGWMAWSWATHFKIAEAFDVLNLTCVKFPACDFPLADAMGMQYNKLGKKLTCQGDTARAIEINSKLYPYLLCNETLGWGGKLKKSANMEYIAEADSALNVTCVEYCKASGTGLTVEKLIDDDWEYVEAKCSDPTRKDIYYFETRLLPRYVLCAINEGWSSCINYRSYYCYDYFEKNEPGKFECRPELTTTTATTTISTSTTTYTSEATSTENATAPTTKHPVATTSRTSKGPVANAEEQNSMVTIGAAIGGILLVLMVIAVILFVCLVKRNRRENSLNGAYGVPEGSNRNDFISNDNIPDEIDEASSEQ